MPCGEARLEYHLGIFCDAERVMILVTILVSDRADSGELTLSKYHLAL